MAGDRQVSDYTRPNGEHVRATLDTYKDREYFNVRGWYTAADGQLSPGRNGIKLPVSEFPAFLALVQELAQELGYTTEARS